MRKVLPNWLENVPEGDVKLYKISFKSQYASTLLVAMVTVVVVGGLSLRKSADNLENIHHPPRLLVCSSIFVLSVSA